MSRFQIISRPLQSLRFRCVFKGSQQDLKSLKIPAIPKILKLLNVTKQQRKMCNCNAAHPDSWSKYAFAFAYGVLLKVGGFLLVPVRRSVLAPLDGTVVEVGCGDGCNFSFYKNASKVFAFDPNRYLLATAQRRAATFERQQLALEQPRTAMDVFVAGLGDVAVAERIPKGSADHIVFCLVLCSIPNPSAAVEQALELLKVGGTIVVIEHIQHPNPNSFAFKAQRWVNKWWRSMADGCELTRRTDEILASHAQLEVIEGPKHYGGGSNFNLFPLVKMRLRKVA